jgi:hypothetical protein
VKNSTHTDKINLPRFIVGPPIQKLNWGYNPKDMIPNVNQIQQFLTKLKREGVSVDDLVATFISRRISPCSSELIRSVI